MNGPDAIGFAGLGQMGGPMAGNIAAAGLSPVVYDKAGTADRAPAGSVAAESFEDLVRRCDTLFLSLPDGTYCLEAARALIQCQERRPTVVFDLSTIGPPAAREIDRVLGENGIIYVDAPVSGGAAGAKAGTITVMCAGPLGEFERHREILGAFSKNRFHVGDTPGQGQALKVLNNFLSATAMAATSEAVLFGLSQGLDMKTLLDVVNVSTGQNSATLDKFPNRILPGTFDAGFKTAFLAKDVRLYLENAKAAGTPDRVGSMVSETWNDCDTTLPGSDFTRIYSFIEGAMKAAVDQ